MNGKGGPLPKPSEASSPLMAKPESHHKKIKCTQTSPVSAGTNIADKTLSGHQSSGKRKSRPRWAGRCGWEFERKGDGDARPLRPGEARGAGTAASGRRKGGRTWRLLARLPSAGFAAGLVPTAPASPAFSDRGDAGARCGVGARCCPTPCRARAHSTRAVGFCQGQGRFGFRVCPHGPRGQQGQVLVTSHTSSQ